MSLVQLRVKKAAERPDSDGSTESRSPGVTPGAAGTGSRTSRVLGVGCLVGLAWLLVLAFALTEPDERVDEETNLVIGQFDAVRMLYVHFPIVVVTYVAFIVTGVCSVVYLRKGTIWWDNTAASSAEIGAVFCALTLVTGSIWGRPIWNTWWVWGDVRTMTTSILFLVFIGYLAYRRAVIDPHVRARRCAVIGIIGAINIPIVYKSVDWWQNRTLHQRSTLRDRTIEDLTLFTMIYGMFVFLGIYAWLMIHRFRVGWMEHRSETVGLAEAIAQRRAQAPAMVADAVTHPNYDAPAPQSGSNSVVEAHGERPPRDDHADRGPKS